MPVSVWLFVPRNIQLVRTVTTSAAPPPPPVSSGDNAKQEKKSRVRQKTLKINSAISEHDLSIKISHMCEWLEKGTSVTIVISKIENKPQVSFLKILSVNFRTSYIVFVSFILVALVCNCRLFNFVDVKNVQIIILKHVKM